MTSNWLKDYDLFLVDILGIVHDGQHPIHSNIQFLNEVIKTSGKRLIFLSNAPRLADKTQRSLEEMGVTPPFDVITSGEATRYFLKEYVPNHKVYHFGAARNQDILENHPQVSVPSPKEADLILLTAFLEENEDDSTYSQEFEKVLASGKRIICANPDTYASYQGTKRRVAGYIAQKLQEGGGDVHYIGKPDPFIYELTFKRFGINPEMKARTIMIGDTLENDIRGANAFGIDSALILTGNTAWQVSHQPDIVRSHVTSNKELAQLIPTYILKSLA